MPIPSKSELQPWPQILGYRVLVSPEMANSWLQSNDNNRHIRPKVVERYAKEMQNGHWKATHQGIAFSSNRLIDGQHRLSAIAACGVPQWLVVFIEQDDEVFGVLDHGTNRTLRDELRKDPRILEPCSFYCALMSRTARGHTALEVQKFVDLLGPSLQRLIDVSGATPKLRATAPIRAAVALRWATAARSAQAVIEDQWRAWLLLDLDAMNTSAKALLKRLDGAGGRGGSSIALDRARRAWHAFNPAQPDLRKIIIRDDAATLDAMRTAMGTLVKP